MDGNTLRLSVVTSLVPEATLSAWQSHPLVVRAIAALGEDVRSYELGEFADLLPPDRRTLPRGPVGVGGQEIPGWRSYPLGARATQALRVEMEREQAADETPFIDALFEEFMPTAGPPPTPPTVSSIRENRPATQTKILGQAVPILLFAFQFAQGIRQATGDAEDEKKRTATANTK